MLDAIDSSVTERSNRMKNVSDKIGNLKARVERNQPFISEAFAEVK